MDESTQKLIERARERRQMLTQRTACMPEAAPRKRRTPVHEKEDADNVLSEKQLNQSQDEFPSSYQDSPKRQCLRETELQLKPDTPAIRGVQARAKCLQNENNDEADTPVPNPRKNMSPTSGKRTFATSPSRSPQKMLNVGEVGSARKTRFAALAQNINNWEDDLSHPVIHKEEEKRPKWQPPSASTPTHEQASTKSPLRSRTPEVAKKPLSKTASPKTTHAPPTPRTGTTPNKPVTSPFTRNSPLTRSKVEWNKSPKPFSPTYDGQSSAKKSKSDDLMTKGSGSLNVMSVGKSASETVVPPQTRPKPIDTESSTSGTPSKRPLSAKLASFEEKITANTPGLAKSTHVPKTPKQVCTPAFSASTPAASKAKVSDPSELPISQRMSQMKDKLVNVTSPGTPRTKEKDPTAFSVGARMSAWENMTSSNLVSDIKKSSGILQVNPDESTPKHVAKFTLTPRAKPALTPGKSFKESIEDRASEVWARKGSKIQVTSNSPTKSSPKTATAKSSPQKAPAKAPSKTHSPTKVSSGTKTVQQRLAEATQNSGTSCSSLAERSRAARLAELEAIQNRWKNGVLKDGSHSDKSDSESASEEKVNPKTPGGKREAARAKAREDFNSKLAEVGLDGSEGVGLRRSPRQHSQNKLSQSTPNRSTPKSSIYGLIKKKDEATPKRVNDSFDDSDDETQKIPRSAALRAAKQNSQDEEFKKPPTPATALEDTETDTDSVSVSCSADEDFGSSDKLPLDVDDDDISLKGFVSEAVRRESVYERRNRPESLQSQSSMDSYDDYAGSHPSTSGGPSTRGARGYQADDDNSEDESMDDEEAGSVDDLLDEAMNDSSEADNANKQQPQAKNSEPDYDPDMDPNNVVLRRRPQPAQRMQHSVNSTDDDDDEDSRPYSLAAYRKSANLHMQQTTHDPIVRASRYVGRQVQEEHIEMPTAAPRKQRPDDKRLVQERIKELQELVQQEQSVIMQTSNALNKCCLGNSYFAGSAEQVECNRVLLIACQKRQCYMTEISRLKDSAVLHPEGPGPQGSLTISDIRLPLKKEFVTKIGTSQDTTTHYFILLIKNNCQVISTQMLSTHDPMMRGSLDFPNLIKINGITGSFKLTMDIYTMNISKEISKDKKKKTPKKTPKKGYAMSMESPGGPLAVRTTSFSHVTSLPLTMKSLDKTSFHLDRLPFLSPLYGQIYMRLKCLMESNVEERGFLTMFDDVSGFGAWHRRWCVLAGNKLCIWKYPDDENRKDPMFLIDLKRCITEKVGLVSRDICARPNTFDMVTVRQPLKGEHDTLVTRTHNTMTSVRHQMSADSKEERIVWCNKLNRALANIRTWNADALKPMKSSSSPKKSSRRH